MKRQIAMVVGALAVGFAAAMLGQNDAAKGTAVRLQLNEVQAGVMSSEQYCTVVFADGHFHSEVASLRHGKDTGRKVYEGKLSEVDWNALGGIIDSDGFRALNVPQSVPPLIIEDVHSVTISVARGAQFQNMEFLDNKSRKPYQAQLKPLLQWWNAFRVKRPAESKGAPDARCALDSSNAVYGH